MASEVVWLTQLCGNSSVKDAFWNPDVTINTDNPDFTECFQDTALVWGTCGLLWLGALIYLPLLSSRPKLHSSTTSSSLNVAKIVCNSLILVISIFDLVSTSFDGRVHAPSKCLVPCVYTATMVLASIITREEFMKGTNSSGFMFCFWLVQLLGNSIKLRSVIMQLVNKDDVHAFSTTRFFVFYALVTFEFTLHLIPDNQALVKKPKQCDSSKYECPVKYASFLERILFTWCSRLFVLGYKGKLTAEDIWDLPSARNCQNNINHLHEAWMLSSKDNSFRVNEKQSTHQKTSWQAKSSLLVTLTRAYGLYFCYTTLIDYAGLMLVYLRPVIMNCLLEFISTENDYAWKGYVLASALFMVTTLRTLFDQGGLYISRLMLYHRVQSSLRGAIFTKCLLLSSSARRQYSVGEIVNLVSVDVAKIADGTVGLSDIFSAPLQTAVSMWLLYKYLGPSSLAGLTSLLVLISINYFLVSEVKAMHLAKVKLKDERTKLINEVLNGIKVIKLYAWEGPFQDKISAIRKREVNIIKKMAYYQTFSKIAFSCAPILFLVVTFTSHIHTNAETPFTAQAAFVALTLVNSLSVSLNLFPSAVATVVQGMVSCGRIEKFLSRQEIDASSIKNDSKGGDRLSVTNGTFSWNTEETEVLKDIDLTLKDGSLTAVVGQVGCGKSSLLAAILGELHTVAGKVNRAGSIAYVPQEAWLRNQTVRDNILFNKEMDQLKYKKTLEACALTADFKILSAGDLTPIGEKGVTLSGGQKQRVSLARAVYHDADLYLMDDPLSAVDSHVGKHLFEQVIGPNGILKRKTRILVTHGTAHLPKMDQIIVMKDGRISECGTYSDLIQQDGPFAEFIRTYAGNAEGENDENADDVVCESVTVNDLQKEFIGELASKNLTKNLRKRRSPLPSSSDSLQKTDLKHEELKNTKSADKQTAKKGSIVSQKINWSVLLNYLQSMGRFGIFFIVAFMLVTGCEFASNIWLSKWSDGANETVDRNWVETRLGVYSALGLTTALMTMMESVFLSIACYEASLVIHQKLLKRINKAPMSFFDTTPIGIILHCFSEDMRAADSEIGSIIPPVLRGIAAISTTVIAISLTSPVFFVAVIPLGVVYNFLQRLFVRTMKQLRRIARHSNSPIYTHLTETINGAASIRAYQHQDIFIHDNRKKIDEFMKARYAVMVVNRWFMLWLQVWGSIVVFVAALLAVKTRSSISVGLAGLSISYALKISDSLAWLVRTSADLENSVISLERIQEFSLVDQEAPWCVNAEQPSGKWPEMGAIAFHKFSTRYQQGLDLVLRGIDCIIPGGEKIGVVGRTGAGKSSLTLSLFRIIEAAEGNIVIDDVITGKIGLHDLRKQLSIIPQDPVLFSGSLRFNLDPFSEKTNEEIYGALELVHLKSFVLSLPDKLDFDCAEGGSNMSVGQRQLVCLARAVLRKTKVLVLDEATAAVDLETDKLIQDTIRSQFQDCTVITIAHRINTVLDYDRIMVMEMGQIAEFDTPSSLLNNTRTIFHSMCNDAGVL